MSSLTKKPYTACVTSVLKLLRCSILRHKYYLTQIKKGGKKTLTTLLCTSWHQLAFPETSFQGKRQPRGYHLENSSEKHCLFLSHSCVSIGGEWVSGCSESKFARKSENNLNATQLLCWGNKKKWQLMLTGDPFVSFVCTTVHSECSTAELRYKNIN